MSTPSSRSRLAGLPTPLAGLALGFASLGACLELALPARGGAALTGASLALLLLAALGLKFLCHPRLLAQDLAHPVAGSLLPTGAMALMLSARAFHPLMPLPARAAWLLGVGLHVLLLCSFLRHRLPGFAPREMLPSWFVPPVGLVVGTLSCPHPTLLPLARALFGFGLGALVLILPTLLWRLGRGPGLPAPLRPTLAILAAPASLVLAGALLVYPRTPLLAVLLAVALPLTATVWFLLLKTLSTPFSPLWSAFTFPLVVGATSRFRLALHLGASGRPFLLLARLELVIAACAVAWVAQGYLRSALAKGAEPLPG